MLAIGSTMPNVPRLRFARRVTKRHGDLFVEGWREVCRQNLSIWQAFEESGVVAWPEGSGDPRQGRYQDIEDEILERTFDEVSPAVVAAFVRIAREVIERERAKQRER